MGKEGLLTDQIHKVGSLDDRCKLLEPSMLVLAPLSINTFVLVLIPVFFEMHKRAKQTPTFKDLDFLRLVPDS